MAQGQARQRLAYGLVFAVCAVFTLAPLLSAHYLPLLDAPNHLGAIAIWRHYDNPLYGFARHYELNLRPVPYWGYFGTVRLLSEILPLEWANKLFLAGCLLSLPAGLAADLRAHGKPVILAVAAFPLAWNYDMALGFIAYVSGIGVLLFGLALLAELRAAPTPRLFVATGAMGFVVYFSHPIPFALWLIALLLYVPRQASWLGLPSFALFAFQIVYAPAQGLGAVSLGSGIAADWTSPTQSLSSLFLYAFDFVDTEIRRWMLVGYVAILVIAAALVRRSGPLDQSDRRPAFFAVILVLLYFALPESLYRPFNWWMLNGRMILPLGLVLWGCVPSGALPGKRAWIVAPLVLLSIAHPIAIARRFADFDRRAAEFRSIAARLPNAPSVLTLVYPPLSDPAVNVDAWREFASYVQVERGGYNPWSWDDGFPMRSKHAKAAPPGHHPEQFDWAKHGGDYEYFLTRNEPAGAFRGRPELSLVTEVGPWRLWQRR